MEFKIQWPSKTSRKPDYSSGLPVILEQQVIEHSKKYLEEFIDQLNDLDRSTFVALPNLISSKEFGKKELPLQCAVKEAYSINPTVFACVNTVAQSASIVEFMLQKKGKDGQLTDIESHEIIDLLYCPNNTQTLSEFIELIVVDLLLAGNCLVWKNSSKTKNRGEKFKSGSGVHELIVLNPDYIDYKDDGFEVTQYIGRKDSPLKGNSWKPEEIIHFRLVNPLNQFWGMSPIQAAYKAVDVDSKILNWWLETLENGCKKDALIKFDHDLTVKQYQHVRNLIEQQVAGFRNGRGFMILGHSAEMQFLDMAPAELDFTGSRKASSKEIMSIFRVPPPLIGELEHSTYNNIKEARLSFWLDTIMPILNDICSVLSKRLLPDFGLKPSEYLINYDPFSVPALSGLYSEHWETVTKMVSNGVPLNIAIRRLNLGIVKLKGGDVGYMSHNNVPLGYYDINPEGTDGKDAPKPKPKDTDTTDRDKED